MTKINFINNCITPQDVQKRYSLPPSISKHLPWAEHDAQNQCFLLHDQTVATVFELTDIATETKPDDYLLQLRNGLQGIFQDVFPSYYDEKSPWILQFYLQDEPSLEQLYQNTCHYIHPSVQTTAFSQDYLAMLKNHCDWMTQKDGIFVDDKVTGTTYRGNHRKIRLVIYRQYSNKMALRKNQTAIQDLHQVSTSLVAKLEGVGIRVKRCTGNDFYDWMVRWFNPSPKITQGNVHALLKLAPYPDDSEKNHEKTSFGFDLCEQFFFSVPESNEKKAVWYFDHLPHRYLTIQNLSQVPVLGQLTRERAFGNYRYGLFDKFPDGCVFVLTVVIQSQEFIKNHLDRIEEGARKNPSMAAAITFNDCQIVKVAIEQGNFLFPANLGIYIRGKNLEDLADKETQIEALLINNGFHVLNGDYELLPIHSYLNHLPMCYDYAFDQKNLYRSGYIFGKQLANLLPLYGREKGTNHPGVTLYNRGGEPLTFDPFNPADKDNNSHLLLLGATGTGKSALSTYLMMQIMATYRPRLVIVDAGNSFALLADYFKSQKLSVHHIEVSLKNPPILNPFSDSKKMLIQMDSIHLARSEQKIARIEDDLEKEIEESQQIIPDKNNNYNQNDKNDKNKNDQSINSQEQRDYMGEMALACQLMITGGESKEQENITRQDRMLILDALIRAAQKAKQDGFSEMIPSDVVGAFREMAKTLENQKKEKEPEKVTRLRHMADSMEFFCKDTVAAKVFNQRGKSWPEADVILFEQGLFKDEGYEAHNALAFMGLMNRTMAQAERHQYEERFTLFFGDEIHTVTKNPLTAIYLTKCSKMSRKFGLWLWLATQNVADFPKDARKMLSMMEFWICLGMSEVEMAAVEEFRTLTDEEKQLFRSVRKSAKKYVEGVILCPHLKTLFRNIPPRLSLALAMTEKHEKAERKRLMNQYHISEIEAAKIMADQMMNQTILKNS